MDSDGAFSPFSTGNNDALLDAINSLTLPLDGNNQGKAEDEMADVLMAGLSPGPSTENLLSQGLQTSSTSNGSVNGHMPNPLNGLLASLGMQGMNSGSLSGAAASIVQYAANQGITLNSSPTTAPQVSFEPVLRHNTSGLSPVGSLSMSPTSSSLSNGGTKSPTRNPSGLPPKPPTLRHSNSTSALTALVEPTTLIGSQTLSPEIMRMIQSQNAAQSGGMAPWQVGTTTWPLPVAMTNPMGGGDMDTDGLAKQDRSRERNREHSRKSRQRKKVFVEQLKLQVKELEMYKMIMESCHDLISVVTTDNKTSFCFASASYSRVLGIDPQELSGKSLYDFIDSSDVESLKQDIQKVTAFGELSGIKYRIRSVDGKYHLADTRARTTPVGITLVTRIYKNGEEPVKLEPKPASAS